MSKSLSRDLRRQPNITEPSQAESQSQARPGQAEPIAPTSVTQFLQAPPICISGLRPGLCGNKKKQKRFEGEKACDQKYHTAPAGGQNYKLGVLGAIG